MSFNTFGKVFRFTTWGESHGPAIGCIIDGCPPLINLNERDIQIELNKRKPGQCKFTCTNSLIVLIGSRHLYRGLLLNLLLVCHQHCIGIKTRGRHDGRDYRRKHHTDQKLFSVPFCIIIFFFLPNRIEQHFFHDSAIVLIIGRRAFESMARTGLHASSS